jgi:hypothetical protein
MFLWGKNLYLLLWFIYWITSWLELLWIRVQKLEEESMIINDFLQYTWRKLQYVEKQFPPENPLRQYITHELLLLASNNDPEKAFDLFFELFDEYKKEKGIIYEWDNPTPVDSDEEESIGQ